MRRNLPSKQAAVIRFFSPSWHQISNVMAATSLLFAAFGYLQPVNAQESGPYSLRNLVSAQYRCNVLFDRKRLSGDETKLCGELYMRLKLHFLENIDWEKFQLMSDEKKSDASGQGYLAFKEWERTNHGMVKQLEAEAARSIQVE